MPRTRAKLGTGRLPCRDAVLRSLGGIGLSAPRSPRSAAFVALDHLREHRRLGIDEVVRQQHREGSLPIRCRAQWIACPSPSGALCRAYAMWTWSGTSERNSASWRCPAPCLQARVRSPRAIEIVLDCPLAPVRDGKSVHACRRPTPLDGILDQRRSTIAAFPWAATSSPAGTRAEARHRQHGLADLAWDLATVRGVVPRAAPRMRSRSFIASFPRRRQ